MSDFLHGWRRKVGLVFLGLSLLLTVGWFRSMVLQDECWSMIGGDLYGTNSATGDLELWRSAASDYDMRGDWYIHVGYLHAGSPQLTFRSSSYVERWCYSVAGLSIKCLIEKASLTRLGRPVTFHVLRGPYWELILIGTLITAALILPRPRRVARRLNEATPSVTSTDRAADAVPAAPREASGC